jgi:hypothetical protein
MRDSLVKLLEDSFRHDVIKLLNKPHGNMGVELGVAEGVFSDRMVKSGAFEIFYGIDKCAGIEIHRSVLPRCRNAESKASGTISRMISFSAPHHHCG